MTFEQDCDLAGSGERLLGFVILNFNAADDTLSCVECFPVAARGIKLFVIDNASTDGSFERLERSETLGARDYCELIQSGGNFGYAGGNNVGIRRALACDCTHVCVLNNDTIVDPVELAKLADYLDSDKDCAFVGPVLLESDSTGRTVQSAGASINLWTGDVSVRSGGVPRETLSGAFDCDYIGGACIMLRACDVEKLGLIPECYFLFFEETEWCLRAKRMGRRVVCCADASIVHKGSASIHKVGGLSGYLLTRNTMRFESRNASKLQCFICFVYNALYFVAKSFVRHDGSAKRICFLIDGIRDVVREPYRGMVRICGK